MGPGVRGYDVVAYFVDGKSVKGNSNYTVLKDGIYYLFVDESHKKLFEANPEKYIPQYDGWCAFGISIGKKISSNPLVWKIVDGKLYLNLNEGIQKIWVRDLSGYIKRADANWFNIKETDLS